MKKENEGKCKICGKETRFGRMCTGYSNYCSTKCRGLDNDIVLKRKNTLNLYTAVYDIYIKPI